MKKELKIDRAIYLADEDAKTYLFLKRNPEWKKLAPDENARNKKKIDGYMRIFRSGKTKRYRPKGQKKGTRVKNRQAIFIYPFGE